MFLPGAPTLPHSCVWYTEAAWQRPPIPLLPCKPLWLPVCAASVAFSSCSLTRQQGGCPRGGPSGVEVSHALLPVALQFRGKGSHFAFQDSLNANSGLEVPLGPFCTMNGESLYISQFNTPARGLRSSTPHPHVRLFFFLASAPQLRVGLGKRDPGPAKGLEFTSRAEACPPSPLPAVVTSWVGVGSCPHRCPGTSGSPRLASPQAVQLSSRWTPSSGHLQPAASPTPVGKWLPSLLKGAGPRVRHCSPSSHGSSEVVCS